MHEKTIRRRRAVLALLVALSLILLTAYFGETPGGGLHAVQRGVLTVISPIQEGANKALKPVRDLFGSIGDTLRARGQRDALRRQNTILRQAYIDEQAAARRGLEAQHLLNLDASLNLNRYDRVNAVVVASSPNLFFSTVNIDKGLSAGVRSGDPVVNGEGLVGKVTAAAPDAAQVTLITDQSSGVSAQVAGTGDRGIIVPTPGNPDNLVLQYLPSSANVSPGDYVSTAGTVAAQDASLFPPDIPIGQVTSVNSQDINKAVNVRPLAQLRKLDIVQVLTRGAAGSRSGQVTASLDQLPAAGSEPASSGIGTGVQQASTGTTPGR